MKKLAFIVLTFVVLNSCKKATLNGNYFAFGSASGMCSGNCTTFFLIKKDNLYPDDMKYYDNKKLKFKNEKLSENSSQITLGDWLTHFTYGVFDGEKFQLLTYKQ